MPSKGDKKPSKKTLEKIRGKGNPDEVGSKQEGWFQQVVERDEEWGYFVFQQRNGNSLLKILSDILSLSGDELIFFGVICALAISMSLIRVCGYIRDMGCIEESLWDCFGACSVCTFVESMFKLTFQRERPKYIEQSHFISIYGEWFSFPSGHSLRAFYLIFWVSRSKFVRLLGHLIFIPRARMCIPWALGVGWSRVAKGKHFPLDVLFGALIGVVLGWFVEDYLSGYGRAIAKTVGGIFTVANWAYLMLVPAFAGDNKRKRIIYTFVFYVYALSLLFFSLPESKEAAGAQTIESLDDGNSVCKNFW